MYRRRVLAATATAAALGAIEAVDMAAAGQPGDDVQDDNTVQLFGAALGTAVLATAPTLFHRRRRPLFWPGLALIWSGLGINRWARHTLARNYRPVVTVTQDQDVVETGPFAHARHPMYAGGTLICLGIGIAAGSAKAIIAWLLPPLALVRRIEVEERVLHEALGDRYRRYAEGKPRLIPGVW